MKLDEYARLELRRLPRRFGVAREAGGDAAALVYLRKQLTLFSAVLNGDECPAMDPPASVGDRRLDALISAALLDVLGPAWPEPKPLAAAWFPMGETGATRAETIAATPAPLSHVNVYITRADLRWPPSTAPDKGSPVVRAGQ